MVQFKTTLAPQALSNLAMILGTLAPVQTLTSDATATLSVPAADFSGVFWFQTDSNDFSDDTANGDLQFYCDSAALVNEVNFGEAIVPANEIVSIGSVPVQLPIKQDIANWCTRLVLGTGSADFLDNEDALVADIKSKNTPLLDSLKALLDLYGGTPASPRTNEPDNVALDSENPAVNNNYARQVLLSGLGSDAPVMVDRINALIAEKGGSTRVVSEFMPINFQPNDKLVLYAAYGSKNELRVGSGTGAQINPGKENDYLNNLASASPLFPNNAAPSSEYSDGLAPDEDSAKAKSWHVYEVTITFS